jgi:hypothetical protein
MTGIGEHILLGGRWVRGRQISEGDSRFAPYFILCRWPRSGRKDGGTVAVTVAARIRPGSTPGQLAGGTNWVQVAVEYSKCNHQETKKRKAKGLSEEQKASGSEGEAELGRTIVYGPSVICT